MAAAPPAAQSAFDVEAPRPASLELQQQQQEVEGGDDSKVLQPRSPLSARGEAWRDAGEGLGLVTWTITAGLDIALAVVLLSNGECGCWGHLVQLRLMGLSVYQEEQQQRLRRSLQRPPCSELPKDTQCKHNPPPKLLARA